MPSSNNPKFKADKDDTYDTKVFSTFTKITAGDTITIEQAPFIIIVNPETRTDKTRAGEMSAEFSTKWFTMSNCKISETGKVVYSFSTDKAKKTAAGRVVRISLWYKGEEDWFADSDPTKSFFYQIS